MFSPEFFKDEENRTVKTQLEKQNFFVKEISGKNATVMNFDMNLRQFPFDIFHISSHGGEIGGFSIEELFEDRDGNEHIVTYEQVLAITPSPKKDILSVQQMVYYKKFDGLTWKSQELKTSIPNYVFVDMYNAMKKSLASQKKVTAVSKIAHSRSIKCSDAIYQGLFNSIASYTSPFIFNNTCWSWSEIAEPFILSGARGYLGTLWSVDNDAAANFAIEFYQNAEKESIIFSMHKALATLRGSKYENIYIFWGLHFTSINKSYTLEESRKKIFRQLLMDLNISKKSLKHTNQESIDKIKEFIQWSTRELSTTFNKELLALQKEYLKSLK